MLKGLFALKAQKINSSKDLKWEEQVLLEKLPALTWRIVFEKLASDFQSLQTCSEASKFFRSLIWKNGQVCLGAKKILPSVLRKWIDRRDMKDDYQSDPMLLLLTLINLKPRITTFEIFVDGKFRPQNQVLNLFLQLQSDNLEVFHISCLGLDSDPVVIDLTRAEIKRVRDLKLMRSVSRFQRRFQPEWEYRKSLYFVFPEHNEWSDCQYPNFPALEKLTLSLGFLENWSDFFELPLTKRKGLIPIFGPTPLKHVRFIELITTAVNLDKWWDNESSWAVYGALKAFPNLVSLEIPTIALKRFWSPVYSDVGNLKRLTLTLSTLDKHKHAFDMYITGYGKEVCAALFANPTRDPVQVREEIETKNARRIANEKYHPDADRIYLDIQLRLKGSRVPNLTNFSNLKVLRIKSESAKWGPTVVSCLDFLNMKSLKLLDFCGSKPVNIPDEMIQKMRKRFTFLCE